MGKGSIHFTSPPIKQSELFKWLIHHPSLLFRFVATLTRKANVFRQTFTYFGTMTFLHLLYRLTSFTSTPVSQICIPRFTTDQSLLLNDNDVWTNTGEVEGMQTPLNLMTCVSFYKSHYQNATHHKQYKTTLPTTVDKAVQLTRRS